MHMMAMMEERIARALRAIRFPFRARLTGLDGAPGIQLAQGQGLAGETLQAVELIQQFGFSSGVPENSQLVVLPLAGKTVGSVIVATENGAFRVRVKSGETCVYNQWGAKITLKKDRLVEVDCDRFVVRAAEAITMETRQWTALASDGVAFQTPALTFSGVEGGSSQARMTGNLDVNGAIATSGDQVAGGVSQIGHVHGGVQPGGGSTGRPA